ncbi:MAG: ABC transporter permease subunit [Oscillochloris sp.]|nr:ABC transporter permease subunit [Oscillochloris sp.]
MRHKLLRRLEAGIFEWGMVLSLLAAALVLGSILLTITARGIRALDWAMLTQAPQGGFYLGKEGGILNAILGSLLLALGATALALALAVPVVLWLHTGGRGTWMAIAVRLALDVLWGTPSIVFGAFGLALMIAIGLRASLLAGMITLALVVLPILVRTFDEVAALAPPELTSSGLALGATRSELAGLLLRQTVPGLMAGTLLAFARAIGDGAAPLFTAGYTDAMPSALNRPVASLPLAIFFQLSTPFPAVQARAYAAALVLTVIVLLSSLAAQVAARRLGRNVIR